MTLAEQNQADAIRELALLDALETIARCGRDVRAAFDHRAIDAYPDSGPPWLDRIIQAQRDKRTPSEADSNMLRLALIGLDAIT